MDKEFVPTIKVVSFKESGKYYSEHTSFLSPYHYNIYGFQLSQLIKNNDHSVRHYSGLTSGFSGECYFLIEVDYGPKQDFCYFLFNNTRK